MNAINFVKAITEITPSRKDYEEKAPDLDNFIDILINNHKIGKKDVHTDVPEKDAILDLIYNYDVSNRAPIEYLKENLQPEDIMIYSDMGNGGVSAVFFPQNKQYFINLGNWSIEDAQVESTE